MAGKIRNIFSVVQRHDKSEVLSFNQIPLFFMKDHCHFTITPNLVVAVGADGF